VSFPEAWEIGVVLAIALLTLVPVFLFWKVFTRVGLSPWLSLLLFIPYVGALAALAVLAFARWPSVNATPEP